MTTNTLELGKGPELGAFLVQISYPRQLNIIPIF